MVTKVEELCIMLNNFTVALLIKHFFAKKCCVCTNFQI